MSTINERINVIENEKIGLKYDEAVCSLIKHMQQHRGLSSTYLGGKSDIKDQVISKEKDIQNDINVIDGLDNQYGDILKSTTKWNKLT